MIELTNTNQLKNPISIVVFLLKESNCPKCKQNLKVLQQLEAESTNETIGWFFCNIEDNQQLAEQFQINSGGNIVILKNNHIFATIISTITTNIFKQHYLEKL